MISLFIRIASLAISIIALCIAIAAYRMSRKKA